MSEMLVTHDAEHGVSYIYLFGRYPAGSAVRTIPVPESDPAICLDLDKDGRLIGIELLRADLLHPTLKAIAERQRLS